MNVASGNFDRVAWIYDTLAHCYSLGQIAAAKQSQIDEMRPGERVLYLGAGGGEDALAAARAGADVACIDISAGMLDQARRKFERAGVCGEFLHADAREHRPAVGYDVVAANFFLNSFPPEGMVEMLHVAAGLVRPGGKLLIADVATPEGPWIYRAIQETHNAVGIGFFWLLGLVPLHPIYDYRRHFAAAELKHRRTRRFRLWPQGPVAYHAMVAERRKTAGSDDAPP